MLNDNICLSGVNIVISQLISNLKYVSGRHAVKWQVLATKVNNK
jgi:hypothetical protein